MIILQDTREKMPWDFSFYGIETKKQKLDTGDYTVEGLEHLLCFERKRNTGEISTNLGYKWKQFSSEFDRMALFKYKYIICEFPFSDLIIFPENSGIPKKFWNGLRMTGNFLQKRFTEETEKRGIEIIYCENTSEAQKKVIELSKEIYQKEIK